MATTTAADSSQKKTQTVRRATTKTKSDPPLDFSFLNITSIKGKYECHILLTAQICCVSHSRSGGSRVVVGFG